MNIISQQLLYINYIVYAICQALSFAYSVILCIMYIVYSLWIFLNYSLHKYDEYNTCSTIFSL